MDADRIKQLEEELAKAKIYELELLHRCDVLETELLRYRDSVNELVGALAGEV